MLRISRNRSRAISSVLSMMSSKALGGSGGMAGGGGGGDDEVSRDVEGVIPPPSTAATDWEAFRAQGHAVVDWIADYYSGIRDRRVKPDVSPGWLASELPTSAPEEPESLEAVLSDLDRAIMPGVTHWQHPRFLAYFSANSTPPGVLAEALMASLNVVGFSWVASPSATELETITMEWLRKAMGLPEVFSASGRGGGVIQGTASEATLVALLAARQVAIDRAREGEGEDRDHVLDRISSKLVGYSSDQAHSSVEKAFMVAGIPVSRFRKISSRGPSWAMDVEEFRAKVEADIEAGFIPFFCCATLGTTGVGAMDPVEEIAEIAKKHGLWVHVDAAWAGSATVCPEYRDMLRGVDQVDSYNFNPHKWLLTNFSCSALWTRDRTPLLQALSLTPEYLRTKEHSSGTAIDYRDWQIPLGRKFGSLKLWIVLRMIGLEGLRTHIRRSVALGQLFESLVKEDERFELATERTLGLVCFRLCGSDELNVALEENVNTTGKTFLVHTKLDDKVVLRAAMGNPQATERDIRNAWSAIQDAIPKEE